MRKRNLCIARPWRSRPRRWAKNILLAQSLHNLVALYHAMDAFEKAGPMVQEEIEVERSFSLVSWEPFEKVREQYVKSLQLHHLPCSLENGPVGRVLLAFKGAIGASVLEEQRLLRASDHPEAREQVEGFQAPRQQFLKATLQGKKDRACQLLAEFEKVEVDLARFVSGLGTAWKSLQVQTAKVQAKIPVSAALIELIRYHRPVTNGNKKLSMETRYGAAMIRHQGEPSFVRLALARRD